MSLGWGMAALFVAVMVAAALVSLAGAAFNRSRFSKRRCDCCGQLVDYMLIVPVRYAMTDSKGQLCESCFLRLNRRGAKYGH